MAKITLRTKLGETSANDLTIAVQDRTYDYLKTTITPEIRVSAFFEEDCANVEAEYAEIVLDEEIPFQTRVTKIIPGSRTRKGIVLPGPMMTGEQLTILVERKRD